MANMSYCRFNNARLDMMDCIDALQEGYNIQMKKSTKHE